MKRFVAVVTGLAALIVLGILFLNELASDNAAQFRPEISVQPTADLELKLSPRLARPPAAPPSTIVADQPVRRLVNSVKENFSALTPPNRTTARYLTYLGAAALLGLLMGSAWRRRPVVVGDNDTAENKIVLKLRKKLSQRDDAMAALELDVNRRVATAAESLNQPLHELLAQHEQTISLINDDLAARDSRIASQSAELDEKSDRLQALENEIAGLGGRDQPLERRIGQQTDEIKNLQQELASRRGEAMALQDELNDSRQRCERLDQQRTEMKQAIQQLGSQIAQSESGLARAQESLAGQTTELDELRRERDELEQQQAISQNEVETLAGQFSAKTFEFDETQNAYSSIKSELHDLLEHRDQIAQQLSEQQNENQTLNELLSTQDHEHRENIAALAAREADVQRLTLERDRLTDEKTQFQNELDELSKTGAAGQTELAALRDQLDNSNEEIANWRDSVTSLEKEIELRADTIEELENELDDKRKQVDSLGIERNGLNDTLAILQTRLDSRQADFATEKQQLQSQVEELESSLDQRVRQLTLVDQQQVERDKLVAELQSEIESDQQQIIELETELGDYRNQIEKLGSWESTISTFRSDLDSRDKIIDDLRADTSRLLDSDQQVLDQTEIIAELENELDRQNARAHELQERIDALIAVEQIAEQSKLENERLLDDLQATRREAAEWRDRLPPLENALIDRDREIDVLLGKADNSQNELQHIQQELTATEEKLAAWDSTVTSLRTDLRERERALHSMLDDFSLLAGGQVSAGGWSAAIGDVSSTMKALAREKSQLQDELGQLQAQAAEAVSLREQLEEQQALLSDTQSQLDALRVAAAAAADDAEEKKVLEHQVEEYRADIEAMRSELEKNQGAVRSADLAELALEKNREKVAKLEKAIADKDERVIELELQTADWIDKHSTLNAKFESQFETVDELKRKLSQVEERFEAQRQTIVKMRDDKLSKDDSEDFPTLTAIVRPGKRS